MKRVLSLFLSCIFVLGVCFSTPVIASAAEPETLEVEFQYEENNECSIKKWGDTEVESLEVPATVDNGNVPYTITGILSGAFSGCEKLESITIKPELTTIEDGAFVGCTALTAFELSDESQYFTVDDGVLFNKAGTKLIAYPAAKADGEGNKVAEYVIPEGVTEIAAGAFADVSETFILEASDPTKITANPDGLIIHKVIAEGEHNVNYVADANKITVKCDGCSEEFGTITLEAPVLPDGAESLVYDGTAKEATVKVEGITGLDEIPAVSYGVDEESNQITPINAGTYTATFTVSENVKVTKEFTIEPKVIDVNLGFGGEQPDSLVYNGNEHILVVDFGEEILYVDDDYTIEYVNNKNAGEIIATVRLTEGGNYAFLDGETLTYSKTINSGINIEKVTPEVTIVKAENLVFTNEEQPLLTTANTTFGTLKFSLENTEDETKWSTDIPTASAVGTHTVYYRVVGDSNVNDLEQQSVEVTISAHNHLWSYEADEETDTITATCEGAGSCNYKTEGVTITLETPEIPDDATSLIYDGFVKEATVTISAENTGITPNVVYTSKTGGVQLVEGKCINAGNYTASITLLDKDENETTVTVSFTIEKATPTVTAPTAITGLVYNGGEQELVNAGTANSGEIKYSLNNETWSGDIPEGLEAGEYTVYYRVENTDNYNGVDGNVNVTIAPKTITATVEPIADQIYTGSAIEPTVVVKDGETELSSETDYGVSYSNNTNVGTATVTITFKGNYSGTATVTFEIVEHVHNWLYSADTSTSTITAICSTDGYCKVENKTAKITLKLDENENWIYDGKTKEFAYIEGTIDGVELPEIVYSGDCINAGDYTASITLGGETVSLLFTIEKATPTTENFKIDLPTNLIFNGDPKTVTVTCGADIGEVTVEYYSGETKLENAPVTPGTYTVKINVAANDNYNAASGITSDDWEFAITECTKHEWKNSKCTICKIDCEHKYEDGKSAISNKVTTPATCVKEGVLLSQCKICDYKLESPLDIDLINGHKMSDWTETVKATCSSTGVEERTCENGDCKHTETRETEKNPNNHTYGDWVVTAATCVEDGEKVKTCTNTECKHELKETIAKDPTAHKMAAEWEVTKAPTCVETGLQVKTCLNVGCDHEIKEVIAIKADAHNLGGWVVTKAAKCTVAGEITRFCKNGNCEYKVTDSLDPDGKTHDFAKDFTVIEATCISTGSKFRACENEGCKEVTEKTEIAIDPDAHKNVETINVKQPTCEEKGYTGDEHCNDCKKTFDPGIEVDALGHTESDWIVDKEATFTEEGARHTICNVCKKEIKKEVIKKLTLATPSPKAYNKTSSIKVKWTDVDNALTYNVYRSDFINNDWTKWKKIGTVKQGVGEFSDKNVVAGKQYKYTVKAYNGEFKSSIKTSNKLTFIAPVKPALTITTTGIILKWDTVLGADKYVVYRSQLVDGKWSDWKKLSTVKDGKTSTTDTTAESGVTYKYSVRAYIGSSYTERKSSKTIVFLAQPTLKISNTEAGIKGSWKTINGATGYVITRAEYNENTKKFGTAIKLGTAGATAKSFTDKTAKEGIKYKYTITAISDSYSSLASSGKVLRRLAQPTVTIENANGAIKGKWTQVTGATKYTVYRSELVDGKWTSWKNLGTTGATAKSFTDKTVKSGVNYKYTVKAINAGSKSSVGASNKVVYLSRPEPKAVNSIYGVKVNWNAITGAESYIVYRKEYVNKKWTEWQQIGTAETNSYIDSTATSGVKYKYTIHAVNGGSLSARKASSSLLHVATPTATVKATEKAINVSWGQIGGATKYVVYRQVLGADGKWSASTKIASLKGVLEFTDTTAEADNTYRYKVVAYNGKVKSSSNATDSILVSKA